MGKTYVESSGACMGSEILLDRPTRTELITGRDHPESHCRSIAYPPMHSVVLVLTCVLILVIHLQYHLNLIINPTLYCAATY